MKQEIKTMIETINQRPRNEFLPLFSALGARDILFSDENNSVQFKVKGDKGIKAVVVKYDEGADLYDVEFFGRMFKSVRQIKGLFCDQLTQTIWEGVVIV